MAYEQSISERNLSSIGRRQALCTFAGISAAVAGFALLGVGTARAAESTTDSACGTAPAQTVTAQEVVQQIEGDAEAARQLAMVEALIPKNLELGSWSIQKVQAPMFGAIPVVMRTPAGESFQVDVLARDPSAMGVSGIADTKHFSLFVANNGSGSKSTDELQARGAKILAHHLSRTERSGTPLPSLLTLVERSSQHPFGTFGVLG